MLGVISEVSLKLFSFLKFVFLFASLFGQFKILYLLDDLCILLSPRLLLIPSSVFSTSVIVFSPLSGSSLYCLVLC